MDDIGKTSVPLPRTQPQAYDKLPSEGDLFARIAMSVCRVVCAVSVICQRDNAPIVEKKR